jgi:hypothetical protein
VETVIESLRSVESARRVAVRFAAQRLTLGACTLLLEARQGGPIEHPPAQTMGQILGGFQRTGAIELLLELGAIDAQPMKITSEFLEKAEQQPNAQEPWLRYRLSAFGRALSEHVLEEMLPKEPSLVERMGRVFARGETGPA